MTIEKQFRQAQFLQQSGNIHQANVLYQKILAKKPANNKVLYYQGTTYYCLKELEKAKQILQLVLNTLPNHISSLHMLMTINYDENNNDKAYHYAKKILALEPEHPDANDILGRILIEIKPQQSLPYFKKALHRSFNRQAIPGILINTLPKSGSLFLWNALAHGLNIQHHMFYVCNQSFANDKPNLWQLQRLALGGAISQAHLSAKPENIVDLTQHLDKMIVHTRDPRQSLLSWTHHIENLQHKNQLIFGIEHPLPPQYYNWSLTQKIDWQIEHYFPILLEWIQSWYKIGTSLSKPEILFTFYKKLKLNPREFFDEILNFFEIDSHKFSYPPPPTHGKLHFRKGYINEWKSIFNDEQVKKCNQLISEELFSVFKWDR